MKTHKEQILSKCRHFNGAQSGACKAGVKYAELRLTEKPGLPCFINDRMTGGRLCEKCQPYTEAEADAQVEESRKRFEKVRIARQAIVDHLGRPWKRGSPGENGTIDCPVCKAAKSLQFSRSGYNGHIAAKCSTPVCVMWME